MINYLLDLYVLEKYLLGVTFFFFGFLAERVSKVLGKVFIE